MLVAVIGHGPSPEGKGLGREIDEADEVIRMFNCEWQSLKDYGEKYTYGIFPPWRKFRWQDEIHRFPSKGWFWMSFGWELNEEPPGDFELIDLSWTQKVLRSLAQFKDRVSVSKGVAGVLIALQKWRPSVVRVYGFDSVLQGRFSDPQYASDHPASEIPNPRVKRDGLITGPHHWAAERDLMLMEAEKAGTTLEFII